MLAIIIRELTYEYFKDFFGANIAIGLVLICVFIFSRLLDPFASLQAHDKNI